MTQDIEKAGLLGLSEAEAADAFSVASDAWHSEEGKAAYRRGQAVGKMQLRSAAFERAIEGDVKCIELAMRFYPEPVEQTQTDLTAEVTRLQRLMLGSGAEGSGEDFVEVLQ